MRATQILSKHTPMIRFLGRRSVPKGKLSLHLHLQPQTQTTPNHQPN